MKKYKKVLLVLLAVLLQTCICPYIKIFNVMPDLLLVYVMYYSIKEKDAVRVMIFSGVMGLITDCLSGLIQGNFIAVYTVCAALMYIIGDTLFRTGIALNVIISFLIFIMGKSLFFVININTLINAGYGYCFLMKILPESILNSFLLLIALLVAGRKERRTGGLLAK